MPRLKILIRAAAMLMAAAFISDAALADPQSAEGLAESARILGAEAQSRAALNAGRPAAPAERLDVEDPFLFELELFAADAMRLSRRIDQAGGPADLGCIFRGMSADAQARLNALEAAETAGEQARIYRDLAGLMSDAAIIAPQAFSPDDEDTAPPASDERAGCPLH